MGRLTDGQRDGRTKRQSGVGTDEGTDARMVSIL